MDIKDNEVETPELIASRIENITNAAGRKALALRASRLRILDAAAKRGGPQNAGIGGGA